MVRELTEALLTAPRTRISYKNDNKFTENIQKKILEIFLVLTLIGYYSLP